jgi:RimJ/RimL family protein N-acetyltransferase
MKPLLMDLPMPIYTPRLQIRPRQIGEGPVIAKAVRESLDRLKPWMPFAQSPPVDEQMEEHCRNSLAQFMARTNFTLSIYDRAGKTFIGSTGFHLPNWEIPSFHIGYWIHKDFEGQGLIKESTNALTRYAFEVFRARRLEIRCDSRNSRSLSVMKSLGYQQEGILRNEALGPDGSIRDTIVTARYDLTELPPLDVSW